MKKNKNRPKNRPNVQNRKWAVSLRQIANKRGKKINEIIGKK